MVSIAPATTTTDGVVDLSSGDVSQALAALDAISSLNLVSAPALATQCGDPYQEAVAAIATYCASRRAFFIVDPPSDWTDVDAAARGVADVASLVRENGAIYWPPLTSGAASAAVTAVYVATDGLRGVWKAPAGLDAVIQGEPVVRLTDAENGILNPLGVNCIRTFPLYGTVVWGARTLAGADALESDWKYVPVRRLALFLESSIVDSLQWTIFEPNAEPLWAMIRLAVGQFLTGLWTQGAFVGSTSREAFFVQCDATTTTQSDIENGRVNVNIGFAPLSPAEFVVLQIGLRAQSGDD